MKTKTSECLSAAGITKVFWIDDFFATPTWEGLVEQVINQVETLKGKGLLTIELVSSKIDLSKSKVETEDACQEILQKLSEKELVAELQRLETLSGSRAAQVLSQPDLSPEEFEALQKAFGGGLRKFSLKEWTSTGAGELPSISSDTLFLIDKEFHRESGGLGGMDGTILLTDVVEKTPAFCILLTHTCTASEQEQRRVTIATERKLQPHLFSVLSKQQDNKLSIDQRFALAIKAVFTHKFNGTIAYTLSESIRNSAQEMAAELTKQSFANLEQALFENANDEGVPEYDVVLRLFDVHQKHKLNQVLQLSTFQNQIKAARNFRKKTAALALANTVDADMSFFREWRLKEIFLDGDGINNLHAPIACGDIFESELAPSKRYVLLAQPCDLMVRDNGKRRAEVALLVQINEVSATAAPTSQAAYRYFDIKGVLGSDKHWQVDFQNLFVADLSVLDFAALNPDGKVQLQRAQSEPTIAMTKGWEKLLKRALDRCFPNHAAGAGASTITASPPRVAPPLGLGKLADELRGRFEGDCLLYPIRRMGKLKPGLATDILAAWATFHTRAALDHDFARTEDSGSLSGSGKLANAQPSGGELAIPLKPLTVDRPSIELATNAKVEPATTAHAESANPATLESALPAKGDAPFDTLANSGASASPPSSELRSRPRD